ncbi:MAG: serine/threonine-protein kinase [Acidobacteriota bacterium]
MTEWGAQSTIGAYRILETLGAGGMGTVHRAEHRLTGEIVALKTVRARSPEAFAAIRREIAALARLDHPGIVRIRAEGVHEGSPWYAMDLLPWPTLRRRVFADAERSLDEATAPTEILRSHFWTMALTPPAAPRASPGGGRRRPPGSRRGIDRGDLDLILTLAARLAGALSYLHGEGIVHRDLKPENVLVGPGDGPVLVDFGLWSTGSGSGKDSLDPGGDIAGTAAYMSPEQARGEMADARSDLYALGCILFELLTARPVFDARSSFDMLGHHLRAEPRAPGARTKGIPPALDELVIALLSKDPRRRPGFAADVEEALVRLGARREERPAPRAAFHLHRPSLRGRRDALDRAMDLVLSGRRGKGALLLVDGSSGMGRTRFANEVGSRARSRGPSGPSRAAATPARSAR